MRLHIEGLGSPMRAHVKEAAGGKLTAFSGLGFLQVGKHLELEDASTGAKRPAHVVRVECEIDPESRVPQLVMSFQYEDEQGAEARAEATVASAEGGDTPEPMVTHEEPPAGGTTVLRERRRGGAARWPPSAPRRDEGVRREKRVEGDARARAPLQSREDDGRAPGGQASRGKRRRRRRSSATSHLAAAAGGPPRERAQGRP